MYNIPPHINRLCCNMYSVEFLLYYILYNHFCQYITSIVILSFSFFYLNYFGANVLDVCMYTQLDRERTNVGLKINVVETK